MAPAPSSTNADPITAVVFVVESSLALAKSWSEITLYVRSVLMRLGEAKMRIGWITYATRKHPTSILCNRFFGDVQPIMGAFKDNNISLGIGTTNSGGTSGMQALEGLVAAVEMIEILYDSAPPKDPKKPHNCHIIHIAMNEPDSSDRPFWNELQRCDDLTWATLPDALKKRNVNYSCMTTRGKIQKFTTLFDACKKPSISPWFQVRNNHHVLLSGFTPTPTKAPTSVKRPAESSPEKPSDNGKRSRTTGPVPVPETPPKAIANPSTAPPPPTSVTSVPAHNPAQPPSVSPQAPNMAGKLPGYIMANPQARQIWERMQSSARALHEAQIKTQRAKQTPNIDPMFAKQAEQEFQQKQTFHLRLTQAARTLFNQLQQNRPATASGNAPNAIPPRPNAGSTPTLPNSMPAGAPMPSNVQNQMQKLVEHQQLRQGQPGGAGNGPSANPMAGPRVAIWQGIFTLRTPLTAQGKDLGVQVVVHGPPDIDLHVKNWPPNFLLVPSTSPRGTMRDVPDWSKRTGGIMCYVTASPQAKPNPQVNASAFKALYTLLMKEPNYCTSSWKLANGKTENGMIIFAMPNTTTLQIMAIFNPINGISELPRADVGAGPMHPSNAPPAGLLTTPLNQHQNMDSPILPPGMANLASRLPPAVMQQLGSLPPEARVQALMKFLQNNGVTANGIGGGAPGMPNMMRPQQGPPPGFNLNMPGGYGMGGNGNNMQAMFAAMNGSPPGAVTGGTPHGINPALLAARRQQMAANMGGMPGMGGGGPSFDMMQSFMQRKDGGP